MMANNQTPLKIYVCWDTKFDDGKSYAEKLYTVLSRREDDYAGESIGIPLYFINEPNRDIFSLVNNSQYSVFILLIDSKMALNHKWEIFVDKLCELTKSNKKIKIYPVAINSMDTASHLSNNLSKINFISLGNVDATPDKNSRITKKQQYLCFEIVHELSRLLFNRERASSTEAPGIAPSIKVFLSHARKDGESYVKDLNKYLSTNTSLDRFVDVYSIPKGEKFEEAINQGIDCSAFLLLCTDAYSSREWCQHEALYAKLKNRPIILVDAVKNGEPRRFPYIANMKTIHLGTNKLTKEKQEQIIYELLLECLKVKYYELFLSFLLELYKPQAVKTVIFPYPPELYTLVAKLGDAHDIQTILYPEPPLNKNEIKVLKSFNSKYEYITPTYLLGMNDDINETNFKSLRIGVSISEISEEGDMLSTNMHLCKMYIELCRYLLARNFKLIYGGNINFKDKTNFIEILQHLIKSYFIDPKSSNIVDIYYSDIYPVDDDIKASMLPDFKYTEVKTNKIEGEPNEQFYSRSLTNLREKINENCDARIVIGGKTKKYSGKLPGVIEEAFIAHKNGVPLYVVGSYGGAAELLVKCLEGQKPKGLDYEVIEYFNKIGFQGLNNGLSQEENKKLCYCDNIAQTIALILSGLKRRLIENG